MLGRQGNLMDYSKCPRPIASARGGSGGELLLEYKLLSRASWHQGGQEGLVGVR